MRSLGSMRDGVPSAAALCCLMLLLAQSGALPLHNWTLLRAGYTLVHHRPSLGMSGSSASPQLETAPGRIPYNVADCRTHFWLQALSRLLSLGVLAGWAARGTVILAAVSLPRPILPPHFLPSRLIVRAPPVSPMVRL